MITYKDTSKLIFAQTSNNDIMNLKAKKPQASSYSGFKSVFDSVLNNTNLVSNTNKASRNNNRPSLDQDSKMKYKSFRDISSNEAMNSNKKAVNQATKESNTQVNDSEAVELQDDVKDHDEQINVLAQMIGLSPNELVTLAKELGFSAEDLQDIKKLSLFMDKLSNVLELNDLQKDMIKLFAQEVSSQLKSVSKNQESENTDEINASKVKTVAESEVTVVDTKMAEGIKAKLDLLIKNAKVESNVVGTEISKVVAAMRAQAQAKIANSQDDTQNQIDNAILTDTATAGQPIVEDASKAKESADEKSSKLDSKQNKADSYSTEKEMTVESVNTSAQGEALDRQMQQQNFINGNVQINSVNSPKTVEKTVFTLQQPIKSTELINQVVEHAKVIIGQDKSEMVIHLKPDHLGKLELKVVTEQGIVAAKFIAESQQVKEVIETNMQLLKDALQKQGIAIDGVSVQVGHDSKGEFQQPNSFNSNNNGTGSRSQFGRNEIGSSKIGVNAFDTLPDRLQQYANESSTINLTA